MTAVKYMHSDMAGAPALTGQVGSMIALLDACLVNGFGTGTVDSVVIAAGIATVTRAAGHPFEAGSVALISGATVTGGSINGEKRVLSATTTTYTFDATGISNQTAGGPVTHKVAPLGFTKPFSGTGLAAYRSADPASTGMYLRVDDTNAQYPRVVGYESMTDVNTGLGPFPTAAQISGGAYWQKSNTSDAVARPWVLVGDSRLFYLLVAYQSSNTAYSALAVFGDPVATRSGDAYCCIVNGHNTTTSGAGSNTGEFDAWDATSSSNFTTMPRSYTGLGSAVGMRRIPPSLYSQSTSGRSGDGSNSMPYPNHPDGGLYVTSQNIFERGTNVFRAVSPGFYHTAQNVTNQVFTNRTRITNIANLSGRTLLLLNSNSGCFGIDITGPWR
jgi:hypothetical protein